MNEIIARLKTEATRRHFDRLESRELFELLLSAACTECCDQHSGGNGTCPPPDWKAA